MRLRVAVPLPGGFGAGSTTPPMLPQDFAVLTGTTNEAVCAALAAGRLASVRISGGDLRVAGVAVDEVLYRKQRAVTLMAAIEAQSLNFDVAIRDSTFLNS